MTLTYDEIIEEASRIKTEAWLWRGAWESLTSRSKEMLRDEMRAALSALRVLAEERGYRLMVPQTYTDAIARLLDTVDTVRREDEAHAEAEAEQYAVAVATCLGDLYEVRDAVPALCAAPDPTKEPTP